MNVSNRYKLPDKLKERRIELVKQAIGDISVTQFAKKAGIAPSILYKILDGTTKASCSADVILAISQNAAEGSGVTLNALRAANGFSADLNLLPEDEARGDIKIAEKLTDLFEEANVSIVHEKVSGGLFGFDCDYMITMPGGVWYVDDERMLTRWWKYDQTDTLDKELDAYSKALARAIGMAQEADGNNKYSILINEELYYNRISELIKTLRLKNCVSVIFVKFNDGRIVKMQESCCLNGEGTEYEALINYGK